MTNRVSWNRVPSALVTLRIVLGPVLVAGTVCGAGRGLLVATLVAAFLSDVFDGVIARRLQVVTGKLRTADSVADRLYFACVALSVWLAHPDIIRAYHRALEATLALVVFSCGIDWVRYRRIASFHAYLAKVCGLLLFLASVGILGFGRAAPFLTLALIVNFVGNLEGMVMVYLLPEWTHDVPSVWHALRLRRMREQARVQ